jgi:hypothetical protein
LAGPPAKQPHSLTQRPEAQSWPTSTSPPNSPTGNTPGNSKDAAAQETFLREVDDALREDQLRNLLLNRGRPILALVAAVPPRPRRPAAVQRSSGKSARPAEQNVRDRLDALQAGRNQTAKDGM